MANKLDIGFEMRQFDNKNRKFYSDLSDEEKKKFSNYLMIRWGSSVEGSRDLQEFYVISTNERLNKHFFTINRHPELQWLCASSVSPGLGSQKHKWIPNKRVEKGKIKVKDLLELYPTMKYNDLETLAQIITEEELAREQKRYGIDSK